MKEESSADGHKIMSMQELRISELCSIAENLGMDQELIGNCLDDYRGAKDSLIAELVDLVDTDRDINEVCRRRVHSHTPCRECTGYIQYHVDVASIAFQVLSTSV